MSAAGDTEAQDDDVDRPEHRVKRCELCGADWAIHLRCAACSIGIGVGHIDEAPITIGDQALCRDCAEWQARSRRTALQAA